MIVQAVTPAPVAAQTLPPAPVATQVSAPAIPAVHLAPPAPSMVQVMTLSHKEDAETMVNALRRRGYDVAAIQDPHGALIHLQVGPFLNRSDAEAVRQRLMQEGYNATVK